MKMLCVASALGTASRLVLITVVMLTAAIAASAGSAAEPFERLPDGRVVLDIYRQKIALPTTEPDLKRIYFGQNKPVHWTTWKKVHYELGDVLENPDAARRTFEEAPFVGIYIGSTWPPEDKGPVYGLFEPGTVPRGTLTIAVRRAPLSNFGGRGVLPSYWPAEAPDSDEDGYFVRPGVTGPNQSGPSEIGYRLPAAQRLFPTDVDLIVICTHTGAPKRQCRQSQRSKDGLVAIGWGWYDESWRNVRGEWITNFFPKSQWKVLDLRLHEAANHFLINKPFGELE